jgi:hypothetical protein
MRNYLIKGEEVTPMHLVVAVMLRTHLEVAVN